jgi:hypothetical protein
MKKIKVEVDVATDQVTFATDQILTLTQKVKLLKRELQTVPEGTAEWQTLNQAFNDNKDALDRVNVKSRELFGTIALLPGPLGSVANSLDNAINSFKIFSSIKTTDLKANIKALGDDFMGILSTLGKLTGITRVYTVLNNALASSFVKIGVGEQAAAAGAKAFSAALISTGVGALIVGLGLAIEALYKFATASDNAAEKQKELNEQISKSAKAGIDASIKFYNQEEELEIARAKNAGKTEDEIFAIRKKYNDFRASAYKRLNTQLVGIDNEAATNATNAAYDEQQKTLLLEEEKKAAKIKNAKEANAKTIAANKQKLAQDKADEIAAQKDKEARQSAAFKVERDAYVSTLDERNAELYKVEEDYEEQRKILIRAGITDFANIEEQKRIAIMNVNYKYDKAEADIRDKAKEDEYIAQLQAYDDEIAILEAQGKGLLEGSQAYFDNAYALEQAAYERKLLAAKGNADAIEAIQIEHNKNMDNLETQQYIAKKEMEMKKYELAAQFGNLLGQIAGKNKKLATAAVIIEKAAAIGQIVASTAIANAKATAALGPAAAPIIAMNIASAAISSAATIVAATKSIAEINKVEVPGGVSGGSGGGSSTSMPSFATGTISAPSMGRTQSQTGVLAGIVQGAVQRDNSRDRPLRAYVVGSDVTTNQQLDRRIRTAARLG